ncbi:MAG: hypothetical protein ORN58_01885, partial [Sediminibacterium sp.]|nr:hypothetical protein [Sediminibacterium sp.]
FKVQTFTITSSAGIGGGISPQGIATLNYGSKPRYTFTPNIGFVLDTLLVNGVKVDSISSYTFDSVKADQTILVKFKVQTFTVTSSAGMGGGISPLGDSIVNYGAKLRYTITPDTGYLIDTFFVNGIKVDSLNSYTFIANENTTIKALFKIKTYYLIATFDNGIIHSVDSILYDSNTLVRYTWQADTDFVLDSVIVNGIKVDSADGFTF